MTTFRIPMKEVPLEIAVAGLDPDRYTIFLSPFSDRHEGPETLIEYLNGPRGFFPTMHGGVAKIVNREQIEWLRLAKSGEPAETPTVLHKLTIIELVGGSRIEGSVWIDRPAEQSRVSDVLNDHRESFIRVDDDESTHFVNKCFIRAVIPR